MRRVRIFISDNNLKINHQFKIDKNNFDYLTKVMRLGLNSEFIVFNGLDGDFLAKIIEINKKYLIAQAIQKTANLKKAPNISLAFALVKNVRIDFIAAKASELGISKFLPITTRRSVVNKINLERFRANIKEACEQCQRNDMPIVLDLQKLDNLLKNNQNSDKILILCDESGLAKKASEVLSKISRSDKEIIILVGPEGGFADEEFEKMRQMPNIHSIALGPRILRADTAIISAITLVQEFLGDF